jgi:hypothetical protein
MVATSGIETRPLGVSPAPKPVTEPADRGGLGVEDRYSPEPLPGRLVIDAHSPDLPGLPGRPIENPIDVSAITDPVPPEPTSQNFSSFAELGEVWHAQRAAMEAEIARTGALARRLLGRGPRLTGHEINHILVGEYRSADGVHQSGGHGQAGFVVMDRLGYRQVPVQPDAAGEEKVFFVDRVHENGVMQGAVGSHSRGHQRQHTWFPSGWGEEQLQQATALFLSSEHVHESARKDGSVTLVAYLRVNPEGGVEIGNPEAADPIGHGFVRTVMRVPNRSSYLRAIFPSTYQRNPNEYIAD